MSSTNNTGISLPHSTKSVLTSYTALAFMLLAVGCGEFKKEKIVTQEVKARTLTSGDASVAMTETDVPHQYQLTISWPSDIKKVFIENDGRRILETDSIRQHFLLLKDNTKYNIKVFSADGDRPVLVGEAQGQTPKDYSFSGVVELKEDLEIEANRVYFSNQTKVQTNGFQLKVQAQKIVSDNAEIFSFLENSKAEPSQDGKSGGLVHIMSVEAIGNLKINLRGQNGGDGVDGLPWTTVAAGGSVGSTGGHSCLKPGIGIGGPLKCWCTSQPGDGTSGANGAKGNAGTKAGSGGSSGKIIVEVSDSSEFTAEPSQHIGLAGVAGKGSDGQEGGAGGPPGNPTSKECRNANQGPQGVKGAKGDDGAVGTDGSKETQCVSIGQGVGKCRI